jgi:Spy/CpxP family protein refolding chaperone
MKFLLISVSAFLSVSVFAAETNSSSEAEAAYTSVITQRADKIVTILGITETNKGARVRDIITQQYRDLNQLHAVRDALVKARKEQAATNQSAADAAVGEARNDLGRVMTELQALHLKFLAKLSAELSPEQVVKVKDGLTYGVVPLTYGVYLKMYPELTDEQKQQILAWLVEAREIAMDGSTSNEKHAVFGKYKGKINNYLSKAGYDAKKGEQNLRKTNPSPENKTK